MSIYYRPLLIFKLVLAILFVYFCHNGGCYFAFSSISYSAAVPTQIAVTTVWITSWLKPGGDNCRQALRSKLKLFRLWPSLPLTFHCPTKQMTDVCNQASMEVTMDTKRNYLFSQKGNLTPTSRSSSNSHIMRLQLKGFLEVGCLIYFYIVMSCWSTVGESQQSIPSNTYVRVDQQPTVS